MLIRGFGRAVDRLRLFIYFLTPNKKKNSKWLGIENGKAPNLKNRCDNCLELAEKNLKTRS